MQQDGSVNMLKRKGKAFGSEGSAVIFPFDMFFFTLHVITEVKQFAGPPSVVSSVRSVSRRAARQQQQTVPIATQG